jgi:hypothetical protein
MVKKIREVWRKMGLFGPDSVPPNQFTPNHDRHQSVQSHKKRPAMRAFNEMKNAPPASLPGGATMRL